MKSALFLSVLVALSPGVVGAVQHAESDSRAQSEAAVHVTLGQSVVALNGPWKFHVGDDPRWADSNFDDSQWETVDLTPTPQTTVPGVPIPGFVSGWETRGHPGYAGYAWYRMRVRISGAPGPLTLLSPEWFDDAFQVFVNGRLVGSFGKFNGPTPELYYGGQSMFALPVSAIRPGPDGSTLIAFRFYMAHASLGLGVRGGIHGPPRIGLPAAATAIFHVAWEREYRRLASALAMALLYFISALLIAMLFAFNRTEKILLWPLFGSVLFFVRAALVVATNSHWLDELQFEVLINLAGATASGFWLVTWWAYFGLQRSRWLLKAILAVIAWNLVADEFFTYSLIAARGSHGLLVARSASNLSIGVAVLLLEVSIVILGWKRAGRDRGILLLAISFYALVDFVPVMNLAHMRTAWQPFGVIVPVDLVSYCASLICFSIVQFGQFRSSLQRQQSIAEDLKQAQEVQQLLIPDQLPHVRGWMIESEYHPAREVGGDFFQIIPHPTDGSILIVAGDVAGKGLQAGMTVAMLVGAIRTESEHGFDPIEILKQLNRRLMAQERAQSTCLALLVQEDGAATLANAGHMPPYLNGVETSIEGSLPLGMIAEAEFPTADFHLEPGDRLVLLSDGVVEAQNERGDLFGFDRIRTLLSKQVSTAEIATTAQAFGQQDDISVLSIMRIPVMIEATK